MVSSTSTECRKPNRFYEPPSQRRSLMSVNPRVLNPLSPPPVALLLYPPLLPQESYVRLTSLQDDDISKYYELSTHIVPAAYPRLTPFVPFSELERKAGGFAGLESKQSRATRAGQVAEQLMELRNSMEKGRVTLDGSENRVLWNVVNRYTRKEGLHRDNSRGHSSRKRVTLLLAHANGFPKEIWEPFLVELCLQLESDGVVVDEAWAIEAVQHGDSGIINREKLGVLFDWSEHSRDLVNFLLNYLPDRRLSTPSLPLHLSRVPEKTGRERTKRGFSDRTVIAIGHSFGGCTSTLAAVNAPRLFSGLVLVDPVIVGEFNDRAPYVMQLAQSALQRRENWSSRQEALEAFKDSPFFGPWDPKVLDSYVKFGLVKPLDQRKAVELKMPGLQEAAVFVDTQVCYETYELLTRLDESIELLWVLASKGQRLAEDERELVWRRTASCENVRLAAGHLIAQEAPTELAREVSAFLLRKFVQGCGVGKSRL